MNRGLSIGICLAAASLSACFTIGNSTVAIATVPVAAPRSSSEHTLVIVLPGLGDDAQDLNDHDIAGAIHESWPEADVLLTSATLAYYRDGKLVPRLHDEIVEPARRKGYHRIWLAGASLGGMGALLYEREHPGELTGIVLFAPFLGNNELLDEIRAAGGPRKWDPGPMPAEMNGDNFQRQVWKMVKGWADRPELVRRVWLASGTSDYMIEGTRLLAAELSAVHYLELPGGHTWGVWLNGAKAVFSRIRLESLGT
ncbi:MAG TPA: alpha/beta hydrolase-fold protein [Burkholderiales bacterium]|nr:alpha/beta hydrolase-fold protein [Burkholderiales bacterium]